MTEKELERGGIIQSLINGKINGTEASKQIGLSLRQTKRLKVKVGKLGIQSLAHGSRGREGNRRLDGDILEKAKKYLKEKYYDFGPTFASEKLEENHGIEINKETVRSIMASTGLWKIKSRKQPKKRQEWRARKDNYGEMQQFDGSYHKWFGDIESCLLLSVDDATGKVTHAKFDYNEGVVPVFQFWQEYLAKNERPLSIYLDKFSTYKVNHKSAVDNKDLITQFQRACNQTGIKLIFANTPQAKGRVERMNKTLQDRLVKELELANITTMDKANEFLKEYIPKFNIKFAVVPSKKANLHKEINKTLKQKLPQIFSIQNQRTVMNDYTIRFKNLYFQLNEKQPITICKKDKVTVEQHTDGTTKISFKEKYLNSITLPRRPRKEIDVKLIALTPKKQTNWKPPADHPWRSPLLYGGKLKVGQRVIQTKQEVKTA